MRFDPQLALSLLLLRELDESVHDRLTHRPETERESLFWEAAELLGIGSKPVKAKLEDTPQSVQSAANQLEREQFDAPTPIAEPRVARLLLHSGLLEADPKDIEAHARATSATAAPEEVPWDAGDERRSMLKRAADPNPGARAELATELGNTFGALDAEARGIVGRLANDEAPEVRSALAWGLALNHESLDAEGRGIVNRLAEDDDPEVRGGLAQGLGAFYGDLGVEGRSMVARFAKEEARWVRVGLADGLGERFPDLDAEGRGIVDGLVTDKDAEVRGALAYWLGRSFEDLDADGRGIVNRFAKDVPEVRGHLIKALSGIPLRGEEGDRLLQELERRQEEEGEEE